MTKKKKRSLVSEAVVSVISSYVWLKNRLQILLIVCVVRNRIWKIVHIDPHFRIFLPKLNTPTTEILNQLLRHLHIRTADLSNLYISLQRFNHHAGGKPDHIRDFRLQFPVLLVNHTQEIVFDSIKVLGANTIHQELLCKPKIVLLLTSLSSCTRFSKSVSRIMSILLSKNSTNSYSSLRFPISTI